MKLIRLKPQRVKPGRNISSWVNARERGYNRDWRRAIDQAMRKELAMPEDHWLDGKPPMEAPPNE